MKIEESLTNENFWDEISQKYPNAFKIFSDWIDEYKKEINWSSLFRDHLNGDAKFSSIKFHNLPHAMQLGIWITFISNYIKETYNDESFSININNIYSLKTDIEKRLNALDNLLLSPLNTKY